MANHPNRSSYKCQHGLTLSEVCEPCSRIARRANWTEHPVGSLDEALLIAPVFAAGLRAEAKRRRALSGQEAAGDVLVFPDRQSVSPPVDRYLENIDCVWPAFNEPRAWLEMIGYRWVQHRYPGGYVLRWRIAGSGGAMTTSDHLHARDRIERDARRAGEGMPQRGTA